MQLLSQTAEAFVPNVCPSTLELKKSDHSNRYTTDNYVLEIYYEVSGSSTSTTLCDETVVLNNGGNNYKAFFSIGSPDLVSTNPTSCSGTQGSITISGLMAGATYAVSYSDDGVDVGPANFVANGSGQIILTGLNAGVYSNFFPSD